MKFEQFKNIEDIVDSLQLDSGTVIARLTLDDGSSATLEVRGEVRVEFDGDIYYEPSDFPQELQDIIAEGKAYDDDRVRVGDNNWFELYYEKDKDCEPEADCVDVEGLSAAEIYEVMANYVNDIEDKKVVTKTYAELTEEAGKTHRKKADVERG